MEQKEAILDDLYNGIAGNEIAADLDAIDQVYVKGEKPTLIEKYSPESQYTIYRTIIEENPDDEEKVANFEYYEEYKAYLKQEFNEKLLKKLQFMGYFKD